MLKQLIKDFQDSSSFIYFLLDHKSIMLAVVATSSFLLKFFLSYSQQDSILESLSNSLEFASIISASTMAVLFFFKDAINNQIVTRISKGTHSVVFGLGECSDALLNNELDESDRRYIIFEQDTKNDKIESFRKKAVGIIQGNALDNTYFENLNFNTMEYAIISMGNDRINIELAIKIIDIYKEKNILNPIKLIVHIVNKDLNTLFHQNFILAGIDTKQKIDIKTFSVYEEVAEKFFEQNFIDGVDNSIVNGNADYHIAIVGNGELALNLIYQAGKIAHLPNENLLHIHLIDKDAEKFKNKVLKHYCGIENILKLHVNNMDSETIEYYNKEDSSVWYTKNLTHVVICYDDEEHNFNIAMDLFNKTYLTNIVDNTMVTQVSFALFNGYQMSSKMNADKHSFNDFYSFGELKDICTHHDLIEEKDDLLAKLIHKGYAEEYNPEFLYDLEDEKTLNAIHDKWYDASRLSDKLSSKAQSKHIAMKLKALGLKYTVSKSKKSPTELLKINRKMLDEKLKDDRQILNLSDALLKDYSQELPKLWDAES